MRLFTRLSRVYKQQFNGGTRHFAFLSDIQQFVKKKGWTPSSIYLTYIRVRNPTSVSAGIYKVYMKDTGGNIGGILFIAFNSPPSNLPYVSISERKMNTRSSVYSITCFFFFPGRREQKQPFPSDSFFFVYFTVSLRLFCIGNDC